MSIRTSHPMVKKFFMKLQDSKGKIKQSSCAGYLAMSALPEMRRPIE